MSELNRRKFMAGVAVAIVSGVGMARCQVGAPTRTLAFADEVAPLGPSPTHRLPGLLPPPRAEWRIPLPAGERCGACRALVIRWR